MMTAPQLAVYPALTRLLQCPGAVEAIADQYWLDSVDAWVRIPDLVRNEDKLWPSLCDVLPEVKDFDCGTDGTEAGDYRRQVRRAALRTVVTASEMGKPTFGNCPLLGGDAFIRMTDPQAGVCRIGLVEAIRWTPSPVAAQRAKELLTFQELVERLEKVICPLLSSSDYPKQYRRWKAMEPLRDFEASSRFPLILPAHALPACPERYTQSYTKDQSEAVGIPFAVAAKLAPPYAAACVREVRKKVSASLPDPDVMLNWACVHNAPESGN